MGILEIIKQKGFLQLMKNTAIEQIRKEKND